MVKITNKCTHVMPDGFRCNRPFTVNHQEGTVHTCEEHRGARTKDGLTRSTNAYAQGGNDIKMREWIIGKMQEEHAQNERIDRMEREIERLTRLVGDTLSNFGGRKHVIQTEVRDIIKELDPFEAKNPELIKINDRLLTIHNRTIKVDARTDDLLDDWDKMVAIGSFSKVTAGRVVNNSRRINRLFAALGLCRFCGEPHYAKNCPNKDEEE